MCGPGASHRQHLRYGGSADIDAEVLAGIARINPEGTRLPARLLRHAFNRAKWLRRSDRAFALRNAPVSPYSMAPPRLVGHPDLVLARAVRRQVITRDEAELIGMTRLEGIGIAQLAAANGYQLGALYLRRERAEARLVDGLPDDDRTGPYGMLSPQPMAPGPPESAGRVRCGWRGRLRRTTEWVM